MCLFNFSTSKDSSIFEDDLESSRTTPPSLQHSPLTPSLPETNLEHIPKFTATSKTISVTVALNTTTPSPTTEKPRNKVANNCPDLEDGDSYTQAAFLEMLTAPCRYDKLTKPENDSGGSGLSKPVEIYVQIDIRHVEASEHLQFKVSFESDQLLINNKCQNIFLDAYVVTISVQRPQIGLYKNIPK